MRKCLTRLLGKRKSYIATISNLNHDKKWVCVVNVTHKNKKVADHVWIPNVDTMTTAAKGQKITFTAIAETYRCKKNQRKVGLNHIKDTCEYNEENHEEIHNAWYHIRKRKSK